MKFDYGETYGNATAKYFQDYRSQSLSNSNSNYAKGGYFPTYYTHQPDLVIGNRTRTRDRWLAAPRYSLSTVDYDRQQELIQFDRVSHINLPEIYLNLLPIFARRWQPKCFQTQVVAHSGRQHVTRFKSIFYLFFYFFIAQFRLHSSSIESGFRYRVKWGNNTYENSQVCTHKIVLKCLYRVLLTFSYPL